MEQLTVLGTYRVPGIVVSATVFAHKPVGYSTSAYWKAPKYLLANANSHIGKDINVISYNASKK
jgi:hypothetical protein